MLCEESSLHENLGKIKWKYLSILKYLLKLPHAMWEIPATEGIHHGLKNYGCWEIIIGIHWRDTQCQMSRYEAMNLFPFSISIVASLYLASSDNNKCCFAYKNMFCNQGWCFKVEKCQGGGFIWGTVFPITALAMELINWIQTCKIIFCKIKNRAVLFELGVGVHTPNFGQSSLSILPIIPINHGLYCRA